MKVTCKIDAISSISTGISAQGNPWQSCGLHASTPNEIAQVTDHLFFRVTGELCNKVHQMVQTAEGGGYLGTYELTYIASTRNYVDRAGENRFIQELYLKDITRVS